MGNMQLSVLMVFPLLVSSSPLPDMSPTASLIPSLSTSVTLSAYDLYSIVERQEVGEKNVLISPLSIQLAASLVYHGARGDSKHQLATMLGLQNVSDHLVQQGTRNLLLSYAELKKNLTSNIELANVIFADESAEVKDSYEEILNESFLTSTQRVNYSDAVESAEIINNWVTDKTNNLIKDLVSPNSFSPTTRMMLLNAVYFKANWQLPFQKAHTTTADGRTGVPFVDANMRELKLTGWMSNRGRQNVASFLVKDLGLDWRLGAEWFESQLLDHDVCSNYGNWNYAAGIGNDPRENRKFNMIKQAMDYDGEGEFVRLWVPELKGLKGGKVHVPWTLNERELESGGVEIGVTYPKPLVLAPEWSRHAAGKQSNKAYQGNNGYSKGQKGINFYFKSDQKGGQTEGRSGGKGNRGGRTPLKGGRVQ